MSNVNNSAVRELIVQRINNINGDEHPDLTYLHVFFPKINTLIGSEGCIRIYNGEDVEKVFLSRGLTKEDYESINSLIKEGKRISDEDSSLLLEIDDRSDKILMGYVNKVRTHLIANGKDVSKFDEDVFNFFQNDKVIFTPVEEYEKELEENKNVK